LVLVALSSHLWQLIKIKLKLNGSIDYMNQFDKTPEAVEDRWLWFAKKGLGNVYTGRPSS